MNLVALSDLHVGYATNRDAVAGIAARPDDWLIVAGDVGETEAHLAWTLDILIARFARVLWVPGNHELWTLPKETDGARGQARYDRMVALCRERGVLTPEDEYPLWPGPGPKTRIVPMFLLYDYSFGPDDLDPAQTVAWSMEEGIRCTDEYYLHADPFPSREAWCRHRLEVTAARIAAIPADERLILVNHFPFRRDLVRLWRIPRFIPWCGTRATEDWHRRWPVDVVVHGHLHMRATDWRDGVRFEEVSLGYPAHWKQEKGIDAYVRTILPHPAARLVDAGPEWHR
jgi:predicted phosphodiesterase